MRAEWRGPVGIWWGGLRVNRVQLWSCGGGRQSAGIAALIVQGRLPKPDHCCIVDTNREVGTTFAYFHAYIRPAMESLGVPVTVIDRNKYATKDLFGGDEGRSPLIPAYTNQSGSPAKLNEWCSGEWKRDVVMRWAAQQGVGFMPWLLEVSREIEWKRRGVDNWLGISADEKHRRRAARRQWLQPTYPLLDVVPMHVSGCLAAVEAVGWPPPPRSRCWMCPNQADAEWAELTADEWEMACRLEEGMQKIDPHAFLHKQMIPLRQVVLNPKVEGGLFSGGCSSGMCY